MSVNEADISNLLPFWVNGTLNAEDTARVAQALATSPGLRAEAEALITLRQQVKDTPRPNSPGSLGQARLMRAIEAETPVKTSRWQGAGRIAASAVLAAVLSSAVTLSVTDTPSNTDDVIYEQASGDDPTAALTVTFQPTASEAAISALLREKGLVIVDGPSALGLYRIALPYDINLEEAAGYLAAASTVIAKVEQSE